MILVKVRDAVPLPCLVLFLPLLSLLPEDDDDDGGGSNTAAALAPFLMLISMTMDGGATTSADVTPMPLLPLAPTEAAIAAAAPTPASPRPSTTAPEPPPPAARRGRFVLHRREKTHRMPMPRVRAATATPAYLKREEDRRRGKKGGHRARPPDFLLSLTC